MEFVTDKKYIITLTEEEARAFVGDLHKIRFSHGTAGITREVLNYLGSRNERFPSGEDVPARPRDPHSTPMEAGLRGEAANTEAEW